MTDTVLTPKEVIDSDYHSYSMYVLENRAIPSAIDGFKPVHRKLVYAMINEHKGKRTKVVDIGSISKFNYHHGETSAMGAVVTLTQEWNNNCPVFTGYGNFGSRLIQEAAAPRYIFASLSEEFSKYFIHTEVALPSFDPENPEPAFYLPVIPWVLMNGISGIAVGFATNILPRSAKTLVSETKRCLKNPSKYLEDNLRLVPPTFPSFRGAVTHIEGNQWKTSGIIEKTKTTEYKITELPIGYDRESYVSFLNDLCDSDKIKDFTDCCSRQGFEFLIKMSREQGASIDKDVMKFFKLEKTVTENLTTLGVDGKLKVFETVPELIHYFVTHRTGFFAKKITHDLEKIELESNILKHKIEFIRAVIDGSIDFKVMKKIDLLEFVATRITSEPYGAKFINIPLYNCTVDEIQKLEADLQELNLNRSALLLQTPENFFKETLDSL